MIGEEGQKLLDPVLAVLDRRLCFACKLSKGADAALRIARREPQPEWNRKGSTPLVARRRILYSAIVCAVDLPHCGPGATLRASPVAWHAVLLRHAATLRAGGAMNSGPTGSVIVSRRIRSISALAAASSRQPVTSSTGCS